MPCQQIGNAYICGLPDWQVYICMEHTTYLMEFRRMFGPGWFRIECGEEVEVVPDPEGHLSFLWDFFDQVYTPEIAKQYEI